MRPRHWSALAGAAALALALACAGSAAAQTTKNAQTPRAVAAKAAAQPAGPIIEQRAVDLLRAASDRLAAAQSMRFTAVASYEYPSRLGPPILYTMRYDPADDTLKGVYFQAVAQQSYDVRFVRARP